MYLFCRNRKVEKSKPHALFHAQLEPQESFKLRESKLHKMPKTDSKAFVEHNSAMPELRSVVDEGIGNQFLSSFNSDRVPGYICWLGLIEIR